MFFADLAGGISSVLQDISDSTDILIDQAAINSVLDTLEQKQGELRSSRFPDLRVPASAFGATPTAGELGVSHSKAHEVVRETLEGVLVDLIRFRDGLERAEKLVAAADTDTAADLDKKRAAATVLVNVSRYSEGDRRNDAVRDDLNSGG